MKSIARFFADGKFPDEGFYKLTNSESLLSDVQYLFFSDGIIKLTVFTIVIIILFELLWHFADSYRVKHYSSCPKELFQKILLILKNAGLTEEVVLQWLVSIK